MAANGLEVPGRQPRFLAVAVRRRNRLVQYPPLLPMKFPNLCVRAPHRRAPIRLTPVVPLHIFLLMLLRMMILLEMIRHLLRLLRHTGLLLTVTHPVIRYLRRWI